MRNFTFNTDSQNARGALVKDYQNLSPLSDVSVTMGETLTVGLYLANNANGYDPLSGSNTLAVSAQLGQPGSTPTSGTYTLSFGANVTTALAYNSTAAQVQSALVALASIGAGNAVVTGSFPCYNVQFIGALGFAAQSLIQVQASLLSAQSIVTVGNIQVGSGTQNAIQSITLQVLPAVYQSTWVLAANGWTGQLSFTSAALQQMFITGQPYIKEVLEFVFTDASANTFKYGIPITIYASVSSVTGAASGVSPVQLSGTFTIPNGANGGTVTGLRLAQVPRGIDAQVMTPAGGFNIFATIDYTTITTAGFTFSLSGITDSGNYRLFYTLTF